MIANVVNFFQSAMKNVKKKRLRVYFSFKMQS